MKPDARHPDPATLALLAGADLSQYEALTARWHVRFCPQCRRLLEELRANRMELADVAAADWRRTQQDGQQLAHEPAWNELEASMRANIRLGLTAGALASGLADAESETSKGSSPSGPTFAWWRWAVVSGAMAFVLTTGWWLRFPGSAALPLAPPPALENFVVQAVAPSRVPADGRAAGQPPFLPVANVSRTETDFDGSTRSRVIDGETGQVTLQQVYVE